MNLLLNFSFPQTYCEMEKQGFFDIANFSNEDEAMKQKYVWLNEMEWMKRAEIINFDYDQDRSNLIVPFAFNANGDIWGWCLKHKNIMPVVYCLHDDYEATYYAASFEEALFRQILNFSSQSNFYVEKGTSYQMDLDEARIHLNCWKLRFGNWFKEEWLSEIDRLLSLELKFYEYSSTKMGKGHYVLITPEECESLIKKYLSFDLIDQTFQWISED